MIRKRDVFKGFLISMALFALVSVSILLMSFSSSLPAASRKIYSVITGVLFWVGIIGGCASYFLLSQKLRKTINDYENSRKFSGLRFFTNRTARIADIVLIGSLILNIIYFIWPKTGNAVGWTALFFFITSIYSHFLLNGRIFNYIINNTKRGRNNEGNE